jgi:endoglucanase
MKQIAVLIIVVFAALLAPAANADVISLKRGLPTDIWISWPEGDRLDEPGLASTFPEYRQSYKGGEFKLVKDAGFDFIRLTIDPAIFLWNRRPEKTEKLLKGVAAAIDEIRAAGLKVDVDMHTIPRPSPNPGTDQVLADGQLFGTYLKVVADIGRVVARYPQDEVAFEPLNEPTADCDLGITDKPAWPALLLRLHAAARAAAPQSTLILSGACWGGASGLSSLDPGMINDGNIIWSFHSYEPFLFSHQGASWTEGEARYVEGLSFPPVKGATAMVLKKSLARLAASDLQPARKKQIKAELKRDVPWYHEGINALTMTRQPFRQVEKWQKRFKIPPHHILLGEFGAIRADESKALSDASRAVLVHLLRHEAEVRGYGWSCWSWSGSFGISATPESRTFSPVMMKALFGPR